MLPEHEKIVFRDLVNCLTGITNKSFEMFLENVTNVQNNVYSKIENSIHELFLNSQCFQFPLKFQQKISTNIITEN